MNPRIVIVDDHPLIRMAVRMVLERDGHEVVAECRTGVDGVQAVRTLKPDLVVLDLVIPDLDGFSVMDRLRGAELDASILVLTSGDTRNYAMRCLQAGASGFVCKDDGLDEISKAVKALLAGYSYFPRAVTDMLRENQQEAAANDCQSAGAELASLTDREITILGLLVKGMNNQEIGRTLMLSHKTVSTYKIRLMSKLNAPNMVELVKVAQRNGMATS
ncbi:MULTISPECIES: response regulator transcription factor [Burkholderia]|uniref:DNA-binding response regulator n=2 Tax=Burkholderia contaminans TaxID=488447 RepID=A0A250LKE1_9BURK|nr:MULTISPECIES: response regulator transcription factor [Burkholderia]UTP27049.1 response regulator transcription factor [Burkholderia sp. FXe9]MBA9834593.1 DNA-binding response regulator [Burkholderia contaminans]MBA9842479.1 DNA-binding response regulator [Burkholderia contaminans]MBA9867361.1 DNA-binding response regulator [Burkholderia contaminans]MBA9909970.1 DNA-binding response regulator [Burkholderia contaminans]